MRIYRICENKKGQFKIQFKVLGLFWWSWKEHYQGIIHLFGTFKEAEKRINKMKTNRVRRKIDKIEKKTWQCRRVYNND